MAEPLCCACDCERPVQLSDPETAFLGLGHLVFCGSYSVLLIDPFLWVKRHFAVLSLNPSVRILTNLHGELRTVSGCWTRVAQGVLG